MDCQKVLAKKTFIKVQANQCALARGTDFSTNTYPRAR